MISKSIEINSFGIKCNSTVQCNTVLYCGVYFAVVSDSDSQNAWTKTWWLGSDF